MTKAYRNNWRVLLCISVLPAALFLSCKDNNRKDHIIDVTAIVNKTPDEVEAILGAPDSTYTVRMLGKEIFCQYFSEQRTEIQYPDSIATDIVISDVRALPFNALALEAFNIDYRKQHPSDYRRGGYIRWTDFDEFSSISFYNTRMDTGNNIASFDIFFKAKDRI